MQTVMPGGRPSMAALISSRIAHRQFIRIVPARAAASRCFGVAQVGQVGVVELQIGAAGRRQIGDLLRVGLGNVVVERLHLRVGRWY